MTGKTTSKLIPFYGGQYPELFEIERRSMDYDGKVIQYLDSHLPEGYVLDVGAGNGFTAEKLTRNNRIVIPMEPDEKMIDRNKHLAWSNGYAQSIPFHSNSFDGLYATWAFFLTGVKDIDEGVREAERVVKEGGPILIVDNYGEDEFCSYSPKNIASSVSDWVNRGFTSTIIKTEFVFNNVEEAQKLLSFYFGEEQGAKVQTARLAYNVVVYEKQVRKT